MKRVVYFDNLDEVMEDNIELPNDVLKLMTGTEDALFARVIGDWKVTVIAEKEKEKMITFEQLSPGYIKVILDGKQVGHIFSPGGSGENVLNAIQVCGFEEAYDLWGCASFGEQASGVTRMKKDIQLLFTEYDRVDCRFNHGACVKCFSQPCICKSDVLSEIFESQLPFAVKREQDLKGKIKYTNEAIAEENRKLQGN